MGRGRGIVSEIAKQRERESSSGIYKIVIHLIRLQALFSNRIYVRTALDIKREWDLDEW